MGGGNSEMGGGGGGTPTKLRLTLPSGMSPPGQAPRATDTDCSARLPKSALLG